MKKFYVYEIVDPRNDKTFYIGKGKNDRMMNHLIPSYIKKNNPKSIKIRDIISRWVVRIEFNNRMWSVPQIIAGRVMLFAVFLQSIIFKFFLKFP